MLYGSYGTDEKYLYDCCFNCPHRKRVKFSVTKFKCGLKNTTYRCKYEEQCRYAVENNKPVDDSANNKNK